jgi:hypothetical protein
MCTGGTVSLDVDGSSKVYSLGCSQIAWNVPTAFGQVAPMAAGPGLGYTLNVAGCAGFDLKSEGIMLGIDMENGAGTYTNGVGARYVDPMGVYWDGPYGVMPPRSMTVTTFGDVGGLITGSYVFDVASGDPADGGPGKHLTGTFSVCRIPDGI